MPSLYRLAALSGVLMMLGWCIGCRSADQIDAISGLRALEVKSGSATVHKALSGEGSALQLSVAGASSETASIKVGESFQLSDGRHFFATYKLISAGQGRSVFDARERSALGSFGEEDKLAERRVSIGSYDKSGE